LKYSISLGSKAWGQQKSILHPQKPIFKQEKTKANSCLDQIWQFQATHGGFFKLRNVKISKKFYQNIDILLDPSITVDSPGYSRLVSWSLNDSATFIDITWL